MATLWAEGLWAEGLWAEGLWTAGSVSPPSLPSLPEGLVVNDIDLSTLGLVVEGDLTGWRDAVVGVAPAVSVPGWGMVVTGAATRGSRRLSVSGWIRPARAGTDVDALLLLLSREPLTLTLSGLTGRVYHGRAVEVTMEPERPVFASGVLRVSLVFECTDPLAYETSATTLSFGAATELPLGTAPVRPVITLGGVTNPVLIYRDSNGTERARLALSGTFSAADPLVIDCTACTLARQSGANASAALASGDFLVFDPRHGAGVDGPWPTLEVAPVPTGVSTLEYARAYRSL